MLESKESRKLLLFPSKYVGDTSFECGAASGSRLSSLAVGNVMIWNSLSFVVSIFKKKMFFKKKLFYFGYMHLAKQMKTEYFMNPFKYILEHCQCDN